MSPTRRDVLRALLAATAALTLPTRARAIGPSSKFRVAQLVTPGGSWDPHPTGLRRLLWEVDKRTSIDVSLDPVQVRLDSDRLHNEPFLYLAGDRAFAPPSPADVQALRRYLTYGGFLLIDSAEGRLGGGFDASVRRLLAEVFPHPSTGLQALPRDHVVYKSFYLLDRPAGRLLIAPQLEAIVHDQRAAVLYGQNDLAGAWARDDYGAWEHACYPGGEVQREQAFRLGINIVMYALCLDYKTDQVHVPFILRRRQWRPSQP